MAKKGKGKNIGFFGAISSLLGSIPAVKSAKKAAGKAIKKQIKKSKNKLKLKNLLKKLKKKRKKKRGKLFTKARKLRNRLSRRKLARKFKRAAKKAVLTVKKATVKQATKKASNAAKAAVKQVKKNEKAQNLKLVSMGLNYIPVFGNIKTLYEMTTGKDMITGQKVVIPKGGSKYINLEKSCPMPQNKGKTKKEKEREIIDKFIEEQRNHEKKLLKSTFNFFFEDIETMLSPDSTWKERAEAA
ncbi:pre-toxin TG domain-containing protein, partial [Lysinibacillus sp. FJAT-14222]